MLTLLLRHHQLYHVLLQIISLKQNQIRFNDIIASHTEFPAESDLRNLAKLSKSFILFKLFIDKL